MKGAAVEGYCIKLKYVSKILIIKKLVVEAAGVELISYVDST